MKTTLFSAKFLSALIVIFLFVFFLSRPGITQISYQWNRVYNGPGNSADIAAKVVVGSTGHIYVTGKSFANGSGYDYCTIKYNPDGSSSPTWPNTGSGVGVRRYNGPGNGEDEPTAIAVDGSGNVYITGFSTGEGTGFDFCTIKYDQNGNPSATWPDVGFGVGVRRYVGPGSADKDDKAFSMAIDGSGNVFLTGQSTGPGASGNPDVLTLKYNASGVQVWVNRLNGGQNDFDAAYSIAIDGAGNVYVAGETTPNATNSRDYITIKYTPGGAIVWDKTFNTVDNGMDKAIAVAVDGLGNVVVTGSVFLWGPGRDYCTVKYNSNGEQQWFSSYNGPGNSTDEPKSMAIDNSGNIYVTGESTGNLTLRDYCTIKYDPDGSQSATWPDVGFQTGVRRYNGTGNSYDDAASLVVDGSGNVYVTGRSIGYGSNTDYGTLKYNSSGVQQWVSRYTHTSSSADAATSIALDASGNVYVTGSTWPGGTDLDFCTIKLSPVVTGVNSNNQIPKEFRLSQNYPNPFNPTTKIDFSTPVDGVVSIKVFDVTGKEVAKLVSGFKNKGNYSIEFNASSLPSGVYFYELETNGFSDTKKMLLVK
jgi:uncharacterized delta-60 repeat protein